MNQEEPKKSYESLERELIDLKLKNQKEISDIYKIILELYNNTNDSMKQKQLSLFKELLPTLFIGVILGGVVTFATLYFLP